MSNIHLKQLHLTLSIDNLELKVNAVRHTDISDLPAEWMSAEPSGSMAKFPKARAARFWTVSSATFLFRITTTGVKDVKLKRHLLKVPRIEVIPKLS